MMSMTREEFWAVVEEIGWGKKTTDTSAVKIELMRRGPEFCGSFCKHFEEVQEELYAAGTKANLDLCCDSWDDTINHVVGLGQMTFKANKHWPERMLRRMNKGNYVESFAYCVPHADDFEDYSPEKLQERALANAQKYREEGTG